MNAFFGKRRFLAPEVVRTSAMDCGPATLKCLLEGFGVPVSYGRLREACQTDVDGTSIDTMEEVAAQLGLDAERVMAPADHLLLSESESLPAIVIVRLANGLTHFVVVWRTHGRFVQVMDPGMGRRWVSRELLISELYIHTATIPASARRARRGGGRVGEREGRRKGVKRRQRDFSHSPLSRSLTRPLPQGAAFFRNPNVVDIPITKIIITHFACAR